MSLEVSRRRFLATSSLAVAGLAVGGTPARGQAMEIAWALPTVGDSLCVPRAWSTYTGAIVSLVQEGLLSFADDLSLTAGVAEILGASRPDHLPLPVAAGRHLRRRQPLTAEDVVASYRYQMNPPRARSSPRSSRPSPRSKPPATGRSRSS